MERTIGPYSRAVNTLFTPFFTPRVRARARTYQRPAKPYRRVPGPPTTPSVPGEHGPTRPCPLRAARGTHGAPRTTARTHPRDGPASGAKRGDLAAALWREGGGRRFLRTPLELSKAPAPPAAAGTRVQPPGTTATAPPAATAAAAAALGGSGSAAFRRPERLRSTASGAV